MRKFGRKVVGFNQLHQPCLNLISIHLVDASVLDLRLLQPVDIIVVREAEGIKASVAYTNPTLNSACATQHSEGQPRASQIRLENDIFQQDIPGMESSILAGFSMKGMASDICCILGPRATAAAQQRQPASKDDVINPPIIRRLQNPGAGPCRTGSWHQ